LISWLITALAGLYLAAARLIDHDGTHRAGGASRWPAPAALGHVLLAVIGPVFWAIYLLPGAGAPGWAVAGILGGVAAFDLLMFARWVPVHRA
jgi:hypothetical protein